jgi:hypothetical protein
MNLDHCRKYLSREVTVPDDDDPQVAFVAM